jgi:hypothetical protein
MQWWSKREEKMQMRTYSLKISNNITQITTYISSGAGCEDAVVGGRFRIVETANEKHCKNWLHCLDSG